MSKRNEPKRGRLFDLPPFPPDDKLDDTKYSNGTLPFMILLVPFLLVLLYGFLS
jgi:hypothetical protein